MKKVLALIIALILSVGAMPNDLFAFSKSKSEAMSVKTETPIAEIPGDDYVPYQYNNIASRTAVLNKLQREVEAVGGYSETFESEAEYIRDREAQSTSNSQVAVASEEFTSISRTITVMTTATGSLKNDNYVPSEPISDALVRLDGVPRYTNGDGEVTARLTRQYVELFVERDGYNPYIEIIDANEGNKTVYLKKPSDDIDVFAVMLEYDEDAVNLLNQEYGFDLYSQDDELRAKITVAANVDLDKVVLYRNGKTFLESETQVFENINFCDFSVGDSLSVRAMKAGIWSKELDLQIEFVDCSELDFAELLGIPEDDPEIEVKNGDGRSKIAARSSEDEGTFMNKIFGSSLNFGINKAIRTLLKKYGSASGKKAATNQRENFVTIIFDSRHKTAKIILGVDLARSKNNGTIPGENAVMSRNSALKSYESFQRSYRATVSSQANKKNPLKLLKGMRNGYKLLKQPGKFTAEKVPAFQFDITLFGFLEIDYSNGFMVRDVGVTVDLDFSFTITGTFMLFSFPCYWYAEMGVDFNIDYHVKRIDNILNLIISLDPTIFLRIGVGAGINGLFSVGGAVQFELDIDNETMINSEKASFNSSGYFNIKSWIELSFLFYSGRFFEQEWFSVKLWDSWKDKGIERQGQAATEGVQLRSLRYSQLSESVDKYEIAESRPQIVSIGENKQLIVWVGNDPKRDDYNYSTLYYATVENGVMSFPKTVSDDGTADFCPTLVKYDGVIYLAWQNSKRIFDVDATVEDVSSSMEIAVAEYDVASDSFVNATNLTNNDYLDALPKFAEGYDSLNLVWSANSESNVFFNSGTNAFYRAELNKSIWQAPALMLFTEDVVVDYSARESNGNIVLTYCVDTDGNLASVDDREIYCKTNSLNKIITGAGSPLIVDNSGILGMYYLKDGVIYYIPSINNIEKVVPVTDLSVCVTEYKLLCKNQLMYTTSSGTLSYAYCDGDRWVNGANIIDASSDQINYFSGFYDGNNITIVSLNTVEEKYQLKVTSYAVLNDLAIENILVPYAFSTSKSNDITIVLHNKGAYPISEFELLIDDAVRDTIILKEPIQPSEMYAFEYSVELNNFVPIIIGVRTLNMADAISDNNTYEIETKICEVEISSVKKEGVKMFYTIDNYSDFDVDITLNVRLLNMPSLSQLQKSIHIAKEGQVVVEVNTEEFEIMHTGVLDVCVIAEITTDERLLYPVSSTYQTQIDFGTVTAINPYKNLLEKAKRYL